MADNMDVTPGTGKTIAADEIGGALHQRVKISFGADGAAADLDGTQHIGQVGGWVFDVPVTPIVTAGAYSINDIMGGLLEFDLVSRVNDEGVIISGVQIVSKAAVAPNLDLILFNADPTGTTKTDNAAYSLAAADAFKAVKALPLITLGAAWYDHGTPNSLSLDNIGLAMKPASGTRKIYGLLVDRTGVTLTSTSDIQVRLRGVGA
jgi:hypothetical protein